MKICLINNLYEPWTKGGAERITEIMAQKFVKMNFSVIIISTKPWFSRFTSELKKNQSSKIYYITSLYFYLAYIPKALRIFWHLIDMFDLVNLFKIRNILNKEKPDLVITNNLQGIGLLIPRLIQKKPLRHIHILHDIQLIHPSGLLLFGRENILDSWWTKSYASLCRYLLGRPNLVISPSQWTLETHKKFKFFNNVATKILLLPADLSIISPDFRVRKYSLESTFKLLFIGQLVEHKGIIFLIKTLKYFQKKFPKIPIQLIVVGDGPLAKQAQQLSLNINTIFVGKLKREDLNFYFANTHVLIVPSLAYENSPLVIYEAIFNCLPIIATEIGGITELVEKLAGILFKPNDADDLIKKMLLLINNYDYYTEVARTAKEKLLVYYSGNGMKEFLL